MSEQDVKAWWEAMFHRHAEKGDLRRDLMALGARETGMQYCDECGRIFEKVHPHNNCPMAQIEGVHES